MRKTISLSVAFFIGILIIITIENVYWHTYYEPIIQSQENMINDLNRQLANAKIEIHSLQEQNRDLVNNTKPFLVTSLGYYVHPSTEKSWGQKPNSVTVYGTVSNIGQTRSSWATISVCMYGDLSGGLASRLLQNSTIDVGVVEAFTLVQLGIRSIDCPVADSVKDVVLTVHY